MTFAVCFREGLTTHWALWDWGLSTRPEERGDFDKMAIECINEAPRWRKTKTTPKIRRKKNGQDEFELKNTDEPQNPRVCIYVVFFCDYIGFNQTHCNFCWLDDVFFGGMGWVVQFGLQELLQKLQSLNEELLKRQPMEQRREVWDLVSSKVTCERVALEKRFLKICNLFFQGLLYWGFKHHVSELKMMVIQLVPPVLVVFKRDV